MRTSYRRASLLRAGVAGNAEVCADIDAFKIEAGTPET